MEKANTDTTYCTRECKNKCWRHQSKYEFDPNQNYWFTDTCTKNGGTNDK